MIFSFYKKAQTRDILCLLGVVTVMLFFRRYDEFITPALYAEDGLVFLQEYTQHGVSSLWMPYAGYFLSLQRIIAFLFGSLSVNYLYIPACYSAASFVIIAATAIYLYNCASVLGIKNKILYASAFLLVPLGDEVFMNVTNLMWITALYPISFVIFDYKTYDTKYKYPKLFILIILSLTGPYSLLLSPIVVFLIIKERKRLTTSQLLPLVIILFGGIMTIISIKFIKTDVIRGMPGEPETWHLLKVITNNVADLAFLRFGLLAEMPEERKMLLALILFACFIYLYIKCYRKITIQYKYIIPGITILVFTSFISSYWPNESKVLALGVPRYYLISYTCIAWVLIIGLDKYINLKSIVLYMVFFILHSREMRYPMPDMRWKEQILEYYEGKRELIEIFPKGWIFRLPKIK